MKKFFLALFLILCLCSMADSRAVIVMGSADVTAPTLTSATIDTNGTRWIFVFDEAVEFGAGGNGGWAVSMSTQGAITLTYLSGSGSNTLHYTGSPTVNSGETVTAGLDYTQPGNGIEDSAGNDLVSIDDASVTNNSTQGGTYSDITFWWRCEGTTMGAGDYSAGDTTASLNSAAAINTDAVKMGTNGLDLPTNYDYAAFTISSNDIVSGTTSRIGFWLYPNAITSGGQIFQIRQDSTHYILLSYSGTGGEIALNNYSAGGNTVTTSGSGITTGSWFYIELFWDQPNSNRKIYVNSTQKGTSGAAFSAITGATILAIGDYNGNGGDKYLDNFVISNSVSRDFYALKDTDSYPGP